MENNVQCLFHVQVFLFVCLKTSLDLCNCSLLTDPSPPSCYNLCTKILIIFWSTNDNNKTKKRLFSVLAKCACLRRRFSSPLLSPARIIPLLFFVAKVAISSDSGLKDLGSNSIYPLFKIFTLRIGYFTNKRNNYWLCLAVAPSKKK